MSRPIGIALVGSGFALHTQLPAFRLVPGAEVRALVGRDAARTETKARQLGIPVHTPELESILRRDDIDLVCVTTPPDLHRTMSEAVLEAGKHVLCEKPMALDSEEAESMCRVARSTHRLSLVDHELRFAPSLLKMRRLLHDGYIGRPLHAQVAVLVGRRLDATRPFDWWSESRRGGGALGALGSHVIDGVRWMFGEIDAACGALETYVETRPAPGELRPRRVDSDDFSAFWLRVGTSRPLRVSVVLSVVAHRGAGVRLELFGTEGMLRHDDEGQLWGSRRDPAAGHPSQEPPLESLSEPDGLPARDLKLLPDNLWARSFAHLARALVPAVAEGRSELPGAATFEDGLAVQRVLDAIQRSNASGGGWIGCRS